MTLPQWSRPGTGSEPGTPFLFIRGVRPNSPMTITMVESSRPRLSRSSIRLPTVASRMGRTRCIRLSRLEWKSQPPKVNVTNRTPASTSRRASSALWPH